MTNVRPLKKEISRLKRSIGVWIDVKYKLPMYGQNVWQYHAGIDGVGLGRFMPVDTNLVPGSLGCFYLGGNNYHVFENGNNQVTHWMKYEVPKPPKL